MGVRVWKCDEAAFPPHPLQASQAEWPRQTWLGSKGQIIVGAVCLHNVEHCLRPKALRHPLARLSESESRGGYFKSLWSGMEGAVEKTGRLFQGVVCSLFRVTSLRSIVNTSPLYVFKL